MKRLLITAMFVITATGAQAITLAAAQAEAEAWMTPRLTAWSTDFQACFIADPTLRTCHPRLSSSTLPNTAPADPTLATVTNDDPGTWALGCGGCYEDRNRWVDSGVDVAATSPVQLLANTFRSSQGNGAQIVCRIQYDGEVWERGYGLFGIATGFAWRPVE